MPFADIATGARLEYQVWNPDAVGVPVLMLHGMLGTSTIDLAETNAFIAEQGWRVIAPTLRGYGESTPKPRDFPPRFYERDAADVIALMDALELPQVHLVGFSDGGEVTLVCAGKYPHRFASAACWGAVGYFGEAMRPIAQRPRMLSGEFIEPWEVTLHHLDSVAEFGRGWVRGIVHYIDTGGDVSLKFADKISVPLLLMLGKNDTLNPVEYAERFLSKVAEGTLEVFDCGHAIHSEQTEAFRRVLLTHLQSLR